jgi:phosphoenolpyruvate carboxykinase (GTP)
MAMLPFCGYDMGEYFQHWLDMAARIKQPPRMYMVNWFRKDESGKFLWPGFGENTRVLKWIIDRVEGSVDARETPAGLVPYVRDLELAGLNVTAERVAKAMKVEAEEWKAEADAQQELFDKLELTMPEELHKQRAQLRARLASGFGGEAEQTVRMKKKEEAFSAS